MKNLQNISINDKKHLLKVWSQENMDMDISRRDVPVGVDKARSNDILQKVIYDLKNPVDMINSSWQDLVGTGDMAGEIPNNEMNNAIDNIAVFRYSLETAMNNLKKVSTELDIYGDIFNG